MTDSKHNGSIEQFVRLLDIMKKLRSENGCDWDKEQTHESLRQYLIEEAYETVDAIDAGDMDKIAEELGDLALHIVFHAELGEERGDFDIRQVLKGINDKLERRHPHVFSDTKYDNVEEIVVDWEKRKLEEGRESRLEGVPKFLPALQKALRVQEKAASVGFDWDDVKDVLAKVSEELAELNQALESGKKDDIEEELGDLLFSIVNYSRFIKVNPEDALRGTINKFDKRFRGIEKQAKSEGRNLSDMTLEEMDKMWEIQKDIV